MPAQVTKPAPKQEEPEEEDEEAPKPSLFSFGSRKVRPAAPQHARAAAAAALRRKLNRLPTVRPPACLPACQVVAKPSVEEEEEEEQAPAAAPALSLFSFGRKVRLAGTADWLAQCDLLPQCNGKHCAADSEQPPHQRRRSAQHSSADALGAQSAPCPRMA